jgi:ElaB/YqjD/DUF883 family membrane-anchored ribosome-binding protein
MQKVSADRLLRDLSALAADVDELITSTASNATEAIAEAQARVEVSLRNAKQRLKNAGVSSPEDTDIADGRKAAYFRVNAWKAIGIAGGIGLSLGVIAGLKGGSSRRRRGESK